MRYLNKRTFVVRDNHGYILAHIGKTFHTKNAKITPQQRLHFHSSSHFALIEHRRFVHMSNQFALLLFLCCASASMTCFVLCQMYLEKTSEVGSNNAYYHLISICWWAVGISIIVAITVFAYCYPAPTPTSRRGFPFPYVHGILLPHHY